MNWAVTIALVDAEVARLRPFIDAAPRPSTAWRPSDLMKIGFYVILSGRGGKQGAADFLNDMIAEARSRYRAGFYADPLAEPPLARPDCAA